MNPSARLSAALLVGLVLWLPTFTATMRGDVELHHAALRYLLAFLFARVAVGFLSRLVATYVTSDDDGADALGEVHSDEAMAA